MTKHQKLSVLFVIVGLLCLTLAFGIFTTANAYRHLQSGNYVRSVRSARLATPIARVTNTTWESGLRTLISTNNTLLSLEDLQTQMSSGETPSITPLVDNLQLLEANARDLSSSIENSARTSLLPAKQKDRLQALLRLLAHANPILGHFAEGEKTLLVLLQNSNELRATGGFMGSYVLLKFDSGNLGEIIVEDIYDADGQVREYFEPPNGVREYLSDGGSWRLPDANWHPDFAQSAQDTLRFFALGDRSHIDGVVAINLPVVEALLAVTGPLPLSDQKLVVSEENVGQVLRADRTDFFAGSTAKKNVLLQATTQIKLALSRLTSEQKKQTVEQLRQQVVKGNILAYFPNQKLEIEATALGLTGTLGPDLLPNDTLFYYPLESNVGINKVNAAISREFVMTTAPTLTELGISLHNSSTQDGYVNYQRLLFSPGQRIEQIVVNGEQIPTFAYETVTSSSGQEYQQIGFLVTTLPNSTTRIALTLTHPDDFSSIILQKQPGTPDTTLTSITPNGATTRQLTQSFLEYMIE